MERYFNSITDGKLSKKQTFEKIKEILSNKGNDYIVTVGTDSQTHHDMKVVTVIAIHNVGKGGRFFYDVEYIPRTHTLREKLYEETQRSLNLSKELTEFFYENEIEQDIIIHVDMGSTQKSKTRILINEIMGWITAEGFVAKYKPYAGVASTVADRISK